MKNSIIKINSHSVNSIISDNLKYKLFKVFSLTKNAKIYQLDLFVFLNTK